MFTKKDVRKISQKCLQKYPQFSGFQIMRLKDFITKYSEEHDYIFDINKKNKNSPYNILVLVDVRENVTSTMSKERKKICHRACRARRNRIKQKYHYSNIFNRIHGFLATEDQNHNENIPKDKKVFSLSLICSSSYSDKRGVGSILMDTMIDLGKKSNYTDIILEVANEHTAQTESDEESEEESSESEEEYTWSDSSSDEESDEEYGTDINDDLVERLTREFLRKTFRLRTENGCTFPYYNIEEKYINDIIHSYINDEYDSDDYYEYEFPIFDVNEPGEFDYGGYYYNKGKQSQIGLFRFYEKFGFIEDGKLNYEWKAFTTDPFPCLIKSL